MLLAEALDERKKLRKTLDTLQTELPDLLVYEVDEESNAVTAESARESLAAISSVLDRIEVINFSINAKNAVTALADGQTVMGAIAKRDRLMTEYRLLERVLSAVKTSLAADRYSYRKKDDIKRASILSPRELQDTLNGVAKAVADLDIAIQKVNWSVEIDL